MIPRTYNGGNPEDRAYVDDFWAWLRHQPKDAWLLWARCANWDNADTIFEQMIEDPDCDLALVAWVFWGAGPDHVVRNPDSWRRMSLIGAIIDRVERGFYRSSQLYLSRHECAIAAHEYRRALVDAGGASPFRLPRALCGPFEGRRAMLPTRYTPEIEHELEEIFAMLNGGLPRSEDAYWDGQRHCGNLWIVDYLTLPKVSPGSEHRLRALDDAAYIEAIFGPGRAYDAARRAAETGKRPSRWWLF